MRVLFTSGVGLGHLHPKIPLARALAAAGHEVAFALPAKHAARVEASGLTPYAAGLDGPAVAEEVKRRFPEADSVKPEERLRFSLTRIIQIATPAMLHDVLAVAADWRPSLIIHDSSEFAGPIAAAALGIPSVNHSWGPLIPMDELALAAAAVAGIWEGRHLQPRTLAGMFEYLYLDICPPSLQTEQSRRLSVRTPLRPVPLDPLPGESLPPWAVELGRRPVVHVTLGTWFNLATEIFDVVVEGLRDEDVDIVVTVGHANAPYVLGPQPPNVRVERYVPLSALLPYCDAVVTHGGAGSVLACLGRGIPMLFVPQGADQFVTSDLCTARGVGRCLRGDALTPAAVRSEVRALLDDPSYRQAAQGVSGEIASMPAPEDVVPLLERLVG